MKKIIALLISAAMLLTMVVGLTACGGSSAPADNGGEQQPAGSEAAAPAGPSVGGTLSMGTGGDAGTYYAVGGVITTVLNSKTDLNVNYVSTGGSKDNLVSMQDGIYQMATVQSDVMTYAYNGTNTFAESGAIDCFNVLCALYAETVQIVTCDENLKSVADLKGKSVCVGDVGSGTYYNTVDVLAAYGMTIDDINPVYQSFGDSTESLTDGKIDAAFLCAGAPTPAVTQLAMSKPVYLISIDDEHMSKLLEACPYYASYTIPERTYDVAPAATTVTVKATLVGSKDLTEDQAYAIVSTIFENKEEIATLHAKGEELSVEFATEGIAVPFAKGAAKYFAEKGITVATD
ncbi:MAG: TAXI family TRAP transporter solute-binding subunit [Parasporobacterium sp.]|nr:TAXI family TRAP transporter solute-binding subunit [Parasporobacterium sp.]